MEHAELTRKIDAYLEENWETMVEDIETLVRIPSFEESDKATEGIRAVNSSKPPDTAYAATFAASLPEESSIPHADVYKRQRWSISWQNARALRSSPL